VIGPPKESYAVNKRLLRKLCTAVTSRKDTQDIRSISITISRPAAKVSQTPMFVVKVTRSALPNPAQRSFYTIGDSLSESIISALNKLDQPGGLEKED